jgi:hypothetical protein
VNEGGVVRVVASRRVRGWLPVVVACLSLGFGVYGVAGLLGGDPAGFALVPGRVGAGAVAVLGLVGVPAAVGHARTEWSPSAYRPLLWFTGLQVVGAVGVLVAPGTAVGARALAAALALGWAALGIRGLHYSRPA